MRKILFVLAIAGLFIACNNAKPEKEETVKKEMQDEQKQDVVEETDEAQEMESDTTEVREEEKEMKTEESEKEEMKKEEKSEKEGDEVNTPC